MRAVAKVCPIWEERRLARAEPTEKRSTRQELRDISMLSLDSNGHLWVTEDIQIQGMQEVQEGQGPVIFLNDMLVNVIGLQIEVYQDFTI